MARIPDDLDARQVIDMVRSYTAALDILDDYDHQRTAATMFLYFLDRNDALFTDKGKAIDDSTLVAVTIMIAESKPEEKDVMVMLVMNCLEMQ